MSVSSILQLIQKKGRPPVTTEKRAPSSQTLGPNRGQARPVPGPGPSRNGALMAAPRPVDPVVAMLKEKRRIEKEQKEAALRMKKGLAPKPVKAPKLPKPVSHRDNVPSKTAPRLRLPASTHNRQIAAPLPTRPPSKKMNFNELMKKASSIDNSKLSISLKNKSKSPEAVKSAIRPSKPREGAPPVKTTPNKPLTNQNFRRTHASTAINRPQPAPPAQSFEKRAPLPIRQPSSELRQRLGTGSKRAVSTNNSRNEEHLDDDDDDDDDDLDSFIASSEEEELARESRGAPDYDRDEIWAIFNRGKKRRHFNDDDYDSDDMEATGSQILQEEQLSRRRGELEDRKEMENERRLAELKKARKHRL